MNRAKLILGVVIIGSALLGGCVQHAKFDALVNDVQTLNSKVDQLSSEVSSLRADSEAARDDAARANQRLDNMARGYKK